MPVSPSDTVTDPLEGAAPAAPTDPRRVSVTAWAILSPARTSTGRGSESGVQ